VELCGKDTPVYLGAAKPLLREAIYAYFFHGPDGMGGMNYPEPKRPVDPRPAALALIDAVRAAPGEITLITLGPLTNIALAFQLAPDLPAKIPMCYMMGGAACTVGNMTPAAEFNIWVDPEAAHRVFHAGMPIFMVGWEHCRGLANLDQADCDFVHSLDTPYAHFAIDCNANAIKTNQSWLHDPGLPLPDPVTMAIALDPTVCTRHAMHYVDVDYHSEVTRGMTVVDQIGVTKKPANVDVCWEIDPLRWKETLHKTLR
jgi:purine nucleosidase